MMLVAFHFSFAMNVAAQHLGDSVRVVTGPGQLSSGFERNVNTFSWDYNASVMFEHGPWQASASDRFQRTLIRTGGESIKDQNTLAIDASYRSTDKLRFVSSFSSFVFSDDRALGLNDLASTKGLFGVTWNPSAIIEVTPMFGLSVDNQQGIEDKGFMYSTSGFLRDLRFGQTDARAELYTSSEYINPRFQREHRAVGEVLATISPSSFNMSRVSYREIHREFYIARETPSSFSEFPHNPVESRDERMVVLQNLLRYGIADPIMLTVTVDVSQRDILRSRSDRMIHSETPFFDNAISEFTLRGTTQLDYSSERTNAQFKIELSERDETHRIESFDGANPALFARQQRLEEQKNNMIQQAMIAFNLTHALSRSDTLTWSASSVKMQYDTPSEQNFDDRDELFLLTGLRLTRRFNPSFVASLAGDITMRHTVYIFAERSANNTWNRVARLAATSDFRPSSRFVSRNGAEVVANYTVYDFEESVQGQRSFSLRQLTISDSSTYRLHDRLYVDASVHLRWYERGELRWAAFTVRPLQFFEERSIAVSLMHREDRWEAATGIRLFEQTRYGYEGLARIEAGRLRSIGPTATFRYALTGGSYVLVDGWLQFTSENDRSPRATPNVILHSVWNL